MKTTIRFIAAATFLLFALSFQLIKTQISITIRNELGNTEQGVTVQLFETEDDYKAETNPVAEGTTDAKGVVKFKELKAISYYVIARKDDKDNTGGGEQTGKLEANRINKVTIVIQ
ncbi:MAG TPA: hypothetical protein VIN08_00550 [Ohtaekwangia sp.]|uniref:hypothetical protein n=1 Tax=Ohtaekwangia sp. TaxID=2066019 RepID=UPI002F9591C8